MQWSYSLPHSLLLLYLEPSQTIQSVLLAVRQGDNHEPNIQENNLLHLTRVNQMCRHVVS